MDAGNLVHTGIRLTDRPARGVFYTDWAIPTLWNNVEDQNPQMVLVSTDEEEEEEEAEFVV